MQKVIFLMFVIVSGCGAYEPVNTLAESLIDSSSVSQPADFQRYGHERRQTLGQLLGIICPLRTTSAAEQTVDEEGAETSICTEMQWQIPTVLCGAYEEGRPCEDYNPCTFADVCHNGVCAGNWYTYCIPCRRDNDCCGPAFCSGDPADNYARGHAIRTTGLCIAGRCEQRAETCANGCAHPNGCF
ncbi:MAG: hypothetical protein V1928_04770 [Parcubacteria group bacterium]